MAKDADVKAPAMEPIEVEVVAPSAVFSVRLDSAMSRQLLARAHQESRRTSDLLRDAASTYLNRPREEEAFTMTLGGIRISVGRAQTIADPLSGDYPVVWGDVRPSSAEA